MVSEKERLAFIKVAGEKSNIDRKATKHPK